MKENYYSKNLVSKPLLLCAILLLIVIVIVNVSFPLIDITGATTSTTITNNLTTLNGKKLSLQGLNQSK